MDGIIKGLIFWGIVLIGLLAVPFLAVLIRAVSGKTWLTCFGIGALIWYVGAPVTLYLYGRINEELREREIAKMLREYPVLCREALESIPKVSEGIEWIRLDATQDSSPPQRALYDAFGGRLEGQLFGYPPAGAPPPGPFRKLEGAKVAANRSVTIKVRSSRHLLQDGTFYATGVDIEILDPVAGTTLARRRDFTNPVGLDCAGKRFHEANLDFVRRAVPPKTNVP